MKVIDGLQSLLIIGEIVTYDVHFSNYNFFTSHTAHLYLPPSGLLLDMEFYW